MQRMTTPIAGLLLLALLPVAPAAAEMTVDSVIAKHVEARGGKQAWDAIQSMKLTGSFTAFSLVSPFTLHKQRGNRYHIDHMQGSKKVVVGYDGQTPWWENHWFQEGAQEVGGADLPVLLREADFVNPLFEYAERGWKVELLGEQEFEGVPAIAIKVTRDDELDETWFLDPETYLEIGRLSPASDFGRPMQQRTFFDDFRTVNGVTLPFYSETQWYTRDRVMQVEAVEFNVPVDAALFRMPPPPGMGPLLDLVGDWDVKVEQRQQPQSPWSESQTTSSIAARLNNGILEEQYTTTQGNAVLRQYSFDRFNKRYRLTSIDDRRTQLDVLEGEMSEDGALVVSNVDTGTAFQVFGQTVHGRMSILDIGPDGFRLEQEVSTDGGENWWTAAKITYTRKE